MFYSVYVHIMKLKNHEQWVTIHYENDKMKTEIMHN
jgi:hypothetical protein